MSSRLEVLEFVVTPNADALPEVLVVHAFLDALKVAKLFPTKIVDALDDCVVQAMFDFSSGYAPRTGAPKKAARDLRLFVSC